MNLKELAKQWLIEHEHYEDEPTFEVDHKSLCELLETVADYNGSISDLPEYDPKFGDDKTCHCGHPYYRHFDTYSNMDAIGCKYCYCDTYHSNYEMCERNHKGAW